MRKVCCWQRQGALPAAEQARLVQCAPRCTLQWQMSRCAQRRGGRNQARRGRQGGGVGWLGEQGASQAQPAKELLAPPRLTGRSGR